MTVLTNTILIDNSPPSPPGGVEPPNQKPSIPPVDVSPPGVIPGYDPNDPNALRYARIAYANKLITADNAESAKALTPNTWERWTDDSGGTSGEFTMASGTVDYIAIGAHNLFSSGAAGIAIKYATAAGGPYTLIQYIEPDSDAAVMLLLSTPLQNVVEIQVEISNVGSGVEIGVIYAGDALVMQRAIYGGHSPIDLSAKTIYQSKVSDTGQFLSRTIIRQGLQTSFDWRYLDPDWYRQYFQPFVESAKTKPFFISWRPDMYNATALCHTTQDIQPQNMGGGHGLMSVSMSVMGHADA